MKITPLSFLAALALSSITQAADPRPGDYMKGQVSRDVAAGLAKAKAAGKPAVIVTFDANNKKMTTPYTLGGFFKMDETKKLLSENFVQVFAPWSASGVEQYRDMSDKTALPVAIFLNKDGEVIARLPFQYGPADALRKVQEVVSKL